MSEPLRLGLLGYPVAHSRSPVMHHAALRQCGREGQYELIEVPPGAVEEALVRLAGQGFRGVNVTVPHKQAALAACDQVDPLAARVGAVNTITFEDGQRVGTNTDLPGFVASVQAAFGLRLGGGHALVVGAGGAARAVVVGLQDAGMRVSITNRTPETAQRLAAELGAEAVALTALGELARPKLVVNATSLGMDVSEGEPDWDVARAGFAAIPFARWGRGAAYDLIYTPRETAFLAEAAASGWQTTDGLDMLVRQGALAFERWTGVPAEQVLPAMAAALKSA